MKIQKRAVSLACLAVLGMAGSAHAVQVAGEALDVFVYLYPQYQNTTFGDTTTGPLSTLTAGTTTPTNGSGAGKISQTGVNWVQSYVGFKGQKAFGDVRAGYNFEALIMPDGLTQQTEQTVYGNARDVYVFLDSKDFGRLQMGQMDTIYKEYGDRVRMLGVSAANFVSTSGILSGVSWKPTGANVPANGDLNGVTTFNTRINGQLRYQSPNWSGFEFGVSLRPDPKQTNAATTQDQSLQAFGARWSNQSYYVAVSQEVHNNYHPFTGNTAAVPAAPAIANSTATHSKDTATKLSLGYTAQGLRIGADFASLKYTEDALATSTGKFMDYSTTAWQITGEYMVTPAVTLALGYASGGAGTCTLTGAAACSTDGLGGTQVNMGARYDYDKSIGVYLIAAQNNNNSSAAFGTGANAGGNVTNVALGMLIRY
jgi:predicted porin